MAGEARNALCAVRPPGHHAEAATAIGLCVFNNVAIGALHARAAHGLGRVAVIDFDVHHGNGTQPILEKDPGFFFASTHQMPLYPGTGSPSERGVAGNVVNVALRPHADGAAFRRALEGEVLPALAAFAPEFVLISAGFDAHRRDPLAALDLEAEDYAWATAAIAAAAGRSADGRLVSTLVCGYDLVALDKSAAAHVSALEDEQAAGDDDGAADHGAARRQFAPDHPGEEAGRQQRKILERHDRGGGRMEKRPG